MPSNHRAYKSSRYWFIEVLDSEETVELNAVREYIKRCGLVRTDLAAEISIKYRINTAKFFRMLGI